jgi:hypothetical protein
MKKRSILVSHNGASFYNGTTDNGWSFTEVERAIDVDEKYIFDSQEEIENLDNYERLKYWYRTTELTDNSKPKCPYQNHKGHLPKLLRGEKAEVCAKCGTNILADEPYILWRDKLNYCLHCIMNDLKDVKEIYGRIPAKLKEEWKANGREDAIKCMEHILKAEDGSKPTMPKRKK